MFLILLLDRSEGWSAPWREAGGRGGGGGGPVCQKSSARGPHEAFVELFFFFAIIECFR